MSLDALSGSLTMATSWNAQKNVVGFTNPNSNGNTDTKTSNWKTVGAGAQQCQVIAAGILSIVASGTATIDLTNLTDILNATGNVLATLKGFKFHLLSTTDDAVNGTACTQVTIGNNGTNPHPLQLGAGTMTIVLNNGEASAWSTEKAAGRTVSGTAKVVLFTNNDGANAAGIRYEIWG